MEVIKAYINNSSKHIEDERGNYLGKLGDYAFTRLGEDYYVGDLVYVRTHNPYNNNVIIEATSLVIEFTGGSKFVMGYHADTPNGFVELKLLKRYTNLNPIEKSIGMEYHIVKD